MDIFYLKMIYTLLIMVFLFMMLTVIFEPYTIKLDFLMKPGIFKTKKPKTLFVCSLTTSKIIAIKD